MNLEESTAFCNTGVIPSFYAGPNDTVVEEQAAYVLGDEPADMLLVSDCFLATKKKQKKLRSLVCKGKYKLTNRMTDKFGLAIPQDLAEVAARTIDQAKEAASNPGLTKWKDPIYVCLVGEDNYEDPFLVRRFRGKTYCWSMKREMWCFVILGGQYIHRMS
jgi:hypothetical protein